jgi:hypothetical protein
VCDGGDAAAGDDEEKPAVETRAERLYNQLSQITNKDANASLAIATFPEIACRIPRCAALLFGLAQCSVVVVG